MNPSELADNLRRIAAAIDNSENPSRKLVAADIQKLIHKIALKINDEAAKNIAAWHKEQYPELDDLYVYWSNKGHAGDGYYKWNIPKSLIDSEHKKNLYMNKLLHASRDSDTGFNPLEYTGKTGYKLDRPEISAPDKYGDCRVELPAKHKV